MPEVSPSNPQPNPTPPPQKPERKWKKISVIILIFLFLISLVGVGLYILIPRPTEEPTPTTQPQKQATPIGEKEERFVFYRNTSSVYSVKMDGTSEIKLADNVPPSSGGQCCDLKVSRDSSLVAFTNNHNLWVVGIDGKGLKQLTTTGRNFTDKFLPIDVTIIDWSPDDTKILYYLRSVPNQLGGLYPNTPAGVVEDPSVKYGIYLFDLTKGKESFVTKDLGTDGWQYVGWPKNTEKALFNIGRLNSVEFSEYLYSLDLTNGTFSKFSNQRYTNLWVVGRQTSISSDGKFFIWICGKADVSYTGEILCLSNIDGTNKISFASGKWGDYGSPRFLPGDKLVSFQKVIKNSNKEVTAHELYLFDRTTSKVEKKVNNAREFFFPNPDTVIITKNNDIYKVELTTGKETPLAKAANFYSRFYH